MRKTPVIALALLTAAMIPAIQQVQASATTIDGVISDTMCGKKHMLPGKTDAECIQECLRGNAKFALVTDTKVYILVGKPQMIAKLAGKRVHIEGSVEDNTVTATSIREIKAAMPGGMPM